MAKVVGKLRDKAAALVAKGKHKKALQMYLELESLEPATGIWPRRVGEMQRHLGDQDAAITALVRSSARYATQGFLVKALAVCKIILRLDPKHLLAQQQLVQFNEERGIKIAEPSEPSTLSELTNLTNLTDMPLEHVVTGARRREVNGRPSGVIEIPIEAEHQPGLVIDVEADIAEDQAREALTHTPLFSELSPRSLHHLIGRAELVEVGAGDILFRQGDVGKVLYVIAEGRLEVIRDDQAHGEVLAELREGDFFGEFSMVTEEPRSASVRALVDSEVLAIDRQVMHEMVVREPSVLPVMLRFLRDRLVCNLLQTSEFFTPFVGQQRRDLVERFGFLEVDAEMELIAQGHMATALYVVMSGQLAVLRAGKEVAQLGPGDVFGEMSLLTQEPANASVRATRRCLVLELSAPVFREIIMTHPQVLAYVGRLASEREVEGDPPIYEELRLDLF